MYIHICKYIYVYIYRASRNNQQLPMNHWRKQREECQQLPVASCQQNSKLGNRRRFLIFAVAVEAGKEVGARCERWPATVGVSAITYHSSQPAL